MQVVVWPTPFSNRIDGRDGAETLISGAGADVLLFETVLGATNVDSVSGYSVTDDTIQLENAIFTALTATGGLSGTAFVSGAAATTAAHRVIYNFPNGQFHFATLTTGRGLAAGKFVVV